MRGVNCKKDKAMTKNSTDEHHPCSQLTTSFNIDSIFSQRRRSKRKCVNNGMLNEKNRKIEDALSSDITDNDQHNNENSSFWRRQKLGFKSNIKYANASRPSFIIQEVTSLKSNVFSLPGQASCSETSSVASTDGRCSTSVERLSMCSAFVGPSSVGSEFSGTSVDPSNTLKFSDVNNFFLDDTTHLNNKTFTIGMSPVIADIYSLEQKGNWKVESFEHQGNWDVQSFDKIVNCTEIKREIQTQDYNNLNLSCIDSGAFLFSDNETQCKDDERSNAPDHMLPPTAFTNANKEGFPCTGNENNTKDPISDILKAIEVRKESPNSNNYVNFRIANIDVIQNKLVLNNKRKRIRTVPLSVAMGFAEDITVKEEFINDSFGKAYPSEESVIKVHSTYKKLQVQEITTVCLDEAFNDWKFVPESLKSCYHSNDASKLRVVNDSCNSSNTILPASPNNVESLPQGLNTNKNSDEGTKISSTNDFNVSLPTDSNINMDQNGWARMLKLDESSSTTGVRIEKFDTLNIYQVDCIASDEVFNYDGNDDHDFNGFPSPNGDPNEIDHDSLLATLNSIIKKEKKTAFKGIKEANKLTTNAFFPFGGKGVRFYSSLKITVNIKADKKLITRTFRKDKQESPSSATAANNLPPKMSRCSVCNTTYKTFKNFLRHVERHKKDNIYLCHYCPKSSKTSGDSKKHMRIHSGEKPYSCGICKKAFTHVGNRKKHVESHTNQKNFKCDVCETSFRTKCHLESHMRTHTGEKPFICEICDQAFASKYVFNIHMNKHNDNRQYECDYCNKTFYDNSTMRKHLRRHTGEKPYMCLTCGKRFIDAMSLRNHFPSHSDERPFQCDICKSHFKSKNGLRVHQRTHMGDSVKQKCSFCPRLFLYTHNRKVHERIHTGELPYSCSICDKKFRTKVSITNHVITHSGDLGKTHECSICNKRYYRKNTLKEHFEKHSGYKKFGCDICEKLFVTRKSLERHVANLHNPKSK